MDYDIRGSNRTFKMPVGLRHIKGKKICVNTSRIQKEARDRVRNIRKFQRTMARKIGRQQKEARFE